MRKKTDGPEDRRTVDIRDVTGYVSIIYGRTVKTRKTALRNYKHQNRHT